MIADDEFALIAYDEYWLTLMCMCAEVCATLGDRRLAGPLLEHISPFGDQYVMSFVALGAAGRFIGALEATLGRYEDADRSFSTAAHMEQTAGAVIHLARTRVEWARMLLARRGPGDVDRATALLDEVLTATSWLELPAVEQRARELRHDTRGFARSKTRQRSAFRSTRGVRNATREFSPRQRSTTYGTRTRPVAAASDGQRVFANHRAESVAMTASYLCTSAQVGTPAAVVARSSSDWMASRPSLASTKPSPSSLLAAAT